MSEPVQYIDRATGERRTEAIYGEGFLRFTYGNPLGRLALHALVKRSLFSRWFGWRMSRPASRARIAPFIRDYGLDPAEFADQADSFKSFNEFFYRRLRPGARPIHPSHSCAVLPADGRHLAFADASHAAGCYVKGRTLDLPALLADTDLGDHFARGPVVFSRLCPVDYHRFHFPVDGTASAPREVGGPLFSVNPVALAHDISYLWRNKRWITVIDSKYFGKVAMVEVGATCVGATRYTFKPGAFFAKGDEKGCFEFGGSFVATLFEPGAITLDADLLANTAAGLETYARMGERLGEA